MIANLFRQTTSKLINGVLCLDENYQKHLAKFEHVLIQLDITDWHLVLLAEIRQGKVNLIDGHHLKPDVTLRGRLIDLLKVLVQRKKQINFKQYDVEISGSQKVAEDLYRVLRDFNIDWQDKLSSLFGPAIAQGVKETATTTQRRAQDACEQVTRSVSEYLRYEAAYLVSQEELQLFYQEIKILRHDVERLSVRINKLKAMA